MSHAVIDHHSSTTCARPLEPMLYNERYLGHGMPHHRPMHCSSIGVNVGPIALHGLWRGEGVAWWAADHRGYTIHVAYVGLRHTSNATLMSTAPMSDDAYERTLKGILIPQVSLGGKGTWPMGRRLLASCGHIQLKAPDPIPNSEVKQL